MPTRLYFHNATTTISNPPATEQGAGTATITATGAITTRLMDRSIGTAQSSVAITTANNTNPQVAFLGTFVSPGLSSNTTISADTITFNVADQQSATQAAFWVNAFNVYVWRPSTGTKVGTLIDTSSTGTLIGSATGTTEVTTTGTASTSSVSALAGDVIICEVWSRFTQSMGTAYTGTFYYDGTTVNTGAENTAVTNHASFIELTQNLSFNGDPQSLTQDSTFVDTDTGFYSPTVTLGPPPQALTQSSTFVDTDTGFYSHTVFQPGNRYAPPLSDLVIGAWTGKTINSTHAISTITNQLIGPASLTASTTTDYRQVSNTLIPGNSNDDGVWSIDLPFYTTFLGKQYSKIGVTTNGYITFGVLSAAFQTLSDTNPPVPKIRIADGDRSGQRIYYGLEGTAPNRKYRVRFEGSTANVGTLGSPTLLYEAVFYEDGNNIQIQYGGVGGTQNLRLCDGVNASTVFVTSTVDNTGYLIYTTPTNSGNIYSILDEVTPGNDTDYITSSTSGSEFSVALQSVTDPLTSSEQILRYRARSISGNSLIVTLKQGATTIATRTHTGVTSEFKEYNMILSAAECNAITNYNDLRVHMSSI